MREKAMSIEVLNQRMEAICKNIADKPNKFKNIVPSGCISGSASQKWRLFHILPQIIGTYTEEDDIYDLESLFTIACYC